MQTLFFSNISAKYHILSYTISNLVCVLDTVYVSWQFFFIANDRIKDRTSRPPTICLGLATTCSTTSSDSYVMKMNALRWFFTRSNGCSTSTIYTTDTARHVL